MLYGVLGKTDEAKALHPWVRVTLAADLGQRDLALSAMEEEAAKRTDPHDRADLLWMTYVILGMHDEALEVLSDLWYGYAAEDIGPKMDVLDAFAFVELLREAGRASEAEPVAQQLLEILSARRADGEGPGTTFLMLEGKYEEALQVAIEKARDGLPLINYVGLQRGYFALKNLPDYPALEQLNNAWIEEQRALYQELTAARSD